MRNQTRYPYGPEYESPSIRGFDESRPWDLIEIIKRYTQTNYILLDVGCGTAFKTIKLADSAKWIYGVDINEAMLVRARENIIASQVHNLSLVVGNSNNLPFPDSPFNIVTCMLASHNSYEIHRVLKPGGYTIVEREGDRSHWNIKQKFDDDEKGPRGQYTDLLEGEKVEIFRREFVEAGFSIICIQNGFWHTYLTREGLIALLESTPIIRNFDMEKDSETVERIIAEDMTDKGIKTRQNRVLVIAKKEESVFV